jgi:hypothetical protein
MKFKSTTASFFVYLYFIFIAVICVNSSAQEQGSAMIPPSKTLEWGEDIQSDQWWFKETINPMTDKKSWILAYIVGGFPKTHEAQYYCDEEEWTSFHLFGPAMNLSIDQKAALKRIRIDDLPPHEVEWWQSNSLDMILTPHVEQIAKSMYNGKRRFVVEDATNKSIEFSLVGFKEAADTLKKVCPRFLNASKFVTNPKWIEKIIEQQK